MPSSLAAPLGLDRPTVVEVRSTSLLLDWDMPSSPNGIIIQHHVLINGTRKISLTGNQSSGNVTGLLPFTVYLVEVETCNSVGCVRSDPVTVRTAEAGVLLNLLHKPLLIVLISLTVFCF